MDSQVMVAEKTVSNEIIEKPIADSQDGLERARIASVLRHNLVEVISSYFSYGESKKAHLRELLGEACTNATMHASYNGCVKVEIIKIPYGNIDDYQVSLRISNPSDGFEKKRLSIADISDVGNEHGRGIAIMAAAVTRLRKSLFHEGRRIRCGYYFDHSGNPKMGTTVFCLDFFRRSNGRTRAQFNG